MTGSLSPEERKSRHGSSVCMVQKKKKIERLAGSKQREEARKRAAEHGQLKDAITLIGFEGITERQPHI